MRGIDCPSAKDHRVTQVENWGIECEVNKPSTVPLVLDREEPSYKRRQIFPLGVPKFSDHFLVDIRTLDDNQARNSRLIIDVKFHKRLGILAFYPHRDRVFCGCGASKIFCSCGEGR